MIICDYLPYIHLQCETREVFFKKCIMVGAVLINDALLSSVMFQCSVGIFYFNCT